MARDVNPGADRQSTGPDPIVDKSLSGPLLIAAFVMFLALGWALYAELYGGRPWKNHQRRFVSLYTSYLKKLRPRQLAAEKAAFASPELQKLEEQLTAAERSAGPRLSEIDRQLTSIRHRLAILKEPFQDARAKIAALTYELEHATSANGKRSIRHDIEEAKKGPFRVALPPEDGKALIVPASLTFGELERRFAECKSREAQLIAQQNEVTSESRELRRKRNDYLSERLVGLTQQQIDGLLRKMNEFRVEIKQIHIEEAGLVERCESCHLGIREPVTMTAADMGGNPLFVSHPVKDLMAIHDPNRFGCSPCHNGNGLAVSSVRKAHGNYEHWLWPLFAKENTEAGCLQCHFKDRVLEHAPVLTRGRDLYELKGCAGCHRYEGVDRDADGVADVRKEIQNLQTRQKESRLEMDREIKNGDQANSNEEAQKHFARAENLRVTVSNIDAMIGELEQKSKFLMQDLKKIGPNLKDVRLKLRRNWLPVWLRDPHAFRPGTKMPKFRLTDDEIRAISAFIWQSGLDGPLPVPQAKGDAAKGKELFETRGCLACHSIGEGDQRIGGEFAANLSRLGEKANYDYIVRWVHNPRERTRPYCPHEKRDLGPEDYSRHGLPFVADPDHSSCPNDGSELQIQNMTVMPSLRLSTEESRDIATYLMGLKHEYAAYPADVSYMEDASLAARGKQMVGRYGCASCHEIKTLEEAPRIGTELTREGSKPMEQLDFGLLEHKARKEGWYSHRGFVERKLNDPAVYDQGREKAPEDRLRMPNVQLTQADSRALTTFLLGSVDSPFRGEFRAIPAQFRYLPTDQQRDLQEGWWVIKKYNCMGCHTIQVGQKSVLSALPRYQDPDWKEQLPPSLLQEAARTNPGWLARFLSNPALSEEDVHRNGVRTYLAARMPTFNFSPNEVRILVRFFEAAAGQPNPYIALKLEPLDERERLMSRALFSSQAAPCLKCHLTGDERHDRYATAPNFLMAKERLKPSWTARWMLDPQAISPGTAMPSGLFHRDGDRWTFAGPTPNVFKGYNGDHVQLLLRYMFELTPEEQRRLTRAVPTAPTAATRQSETVSSGVRSR